MNWQPIESAPKNNTRILVSDCESVELVWWAFGHWQIETFHGVLQFTRFHITHWMPLPPPPASDGECETCEGEGGKRIPGLSYAQDEWEDCPECGGECEFTAESDPWLQFEVPCDECGGTGQRAKGSTELQRFMHKEGIAPPTGDEHTDSHEFMNEIRKRMEAENDNCD